MPGASEGTGRSVGGCSGRADQPPWSVGRVTGRLVGFRAASRATRAVSAAMLLAEMPELGRMTAGEAVSMTGLAPVPRDSGAMRGRRMIAGGRRALWHVLFQAVLAAACHNPLLKLVAKRLKEKGKLHKLVIIAIARRLITIADAVLRSGTPWQPQPAE